jgi:hypothetical protein
MLTNLLVNTDKKQFQFYVFLPDQFKSGVLEKHQRMSFGAVLIFTKRGVILG